MNSTPGDEHKFLELVNENRNRILKVCRVYAWNPSDQEDLYQEILFQIWRALPGLKDNAYANTWLYRIAKAPPLVARLGLMIMIASLAFDIWKPIRARRASPQAPADAPVTQWLRHELEKVRAESELKRSRLLWDLLPFWIGGVVFVWGLNIDLSSRIFFSAVLTGINAILYASRRKLNQYTWRKADQPLIEELESLLQSNTPE